MARRPSPATLSPEWAIAGTWLRKLRKDRGISQTKLATAIGLSKASVQDYEHGYRTPSPQTRIKICSALGCTPDDIWKETQ